MAQLTLRKINHSNGPTRKYKLLIKYDQKTKFPCEVLQKRKLTTQITEKSLQCHCWFEITKDHTTKSYYDL